MAKYALVASGQLDGYVRFSGAGKQKAWDHVGELLVLEAGGSVTDLNENSLNFTVGILLTFNNTGLVASNGKVHGDILEVSRTVCNIK